jgi:hypothetical protein
MAKLEQRKDDGGHMNHNEPNNEVVSPKKKCLQMVEEFFRLIADLHNTQISGNKDWVYECMYTDLFSVWNKYKNIIRKNS